MTEKGSLRYNSKYLTKEAVKKIHEKHKNIQNLFKTTLSWARIGRFLKNLLRLAPASFFMPKTLEELLKEKSKAEAKIADLKTKLGHPHLDFMCVHDLAESEFNVWSAHLEDIEKQIRELKTGKK